MATKNTEQRNFGALAFTFGMNQLLIKAADTTVLATIDSLAWNIAASGAVTLTGTVSDSSADAGSPTNATNADLLHVNGTASGYLVNNASASVGDTTMPVDTGTGTLTVGDVITFAGDTQQYIITKAHSSGAGTINFFPPLVAAPADNAAITLGTARAVTGLSVGTSGSDINLDSVSITAGQTVSITSGTITNPASTA